MSDQPAREKFLFEGIPMINARYHYGGESKETREIEKLFGLDDFESGTRRYFVCSGVGLFVDEIAGEARMCGADNTFDIIEYVEKEWSEGGQVREASILVMRAIKNSIDKAKMEVNGSELRGLLELAMYHLLAELGNLTLRDLPSWVEKWVMRTVPALKFEPNEWDVDSVKFWCSAATKISFIKLEAAWDLHYKYLKNRLADRKEMLQTWSGLNDGNRHDLHRHDVHSSEYLDVCAGQKALSNTIDNLSSALDLQGLLRENLTKMAWAINQIDERR